MNFASVQKLPLVVVLEDNGYAYSTQSTRQTAAKTFADKACAFGCAAETVDGNDVFAVYDAAKRAVDRARSGEGVTLLEVKTFRMKGHAEHDNQAYVPPELIETWKGKDPLFRFEIAAKLTPEEMESIQQRVKRELDEAVAEAEAAEMPQSHEAVQGLFAGDGYWEEKR
jgi:pyruvate dehydrogenase E1 component alpha subunit/2-oxoisovalerate dehydrogenase E1 component alpha subunit